MNNEQLPIHFAPLQGYTDAIYRSAHARIFGGVASYYTPFVRLEHGDFRRKDVRELDADNNRGVNLTPQLIASTPEKILRILALFIEKGYKNVDINLGCPFPTLAKRHNGAGLLPYPDEAKALLMAAIEAHPEIQFSVKMRLGWEDANECMALLPLLNSLPLSHITMHPRLGKQQYKGEVDLEAFQRFYAKCEKPLIYNGDLLTLDDIDTISNRFPVFHLNIGLSDLHAVQITLVGNDALAELDVGHFSRTDADLESAFRCCKSNIHAEHRFADCGSGADDGQLAAEESANNRVHILDARRNADDVSLYSLFEMVVSG